MCEPALSDVPDEDTQLILLLRVISQLRLHLQPKLAVPLLTHQLQLEDTLLADVHRLVVLNRQAVLLPTAPRVV